uniref:E3 ubiquitin-protein ligase n=1 Tax=Periophthalmus magnuspinnatus TaxID=409849 RepID=A0A3B4B2P5_9GOBI
VQFAAAQRIKSSQAVIQRHFADLLGVLLPAMSRKNTPSIVEVDFFHLLVGLVLSVPSLYQEETVDLQPSAVSAAYNHLYILHLVTMAHMLQVLFTSTGTYTLDDTEEAKAAAEWYAMVSQYTKRYAMCGSAVAERVKRGIEPFLRCAALFFNCLTGVHPPEELFTTAGQLEPLCIQTTRMVMHFLITANFIFCIIIIIIITITIIIIIILHIYLFIDQLFCRYPRRRNRLIDLPEDYSALLNQASHFQCPKSTDDERKHPTLCLCCGAMLCSLSSCCLSQVDGEDVGACTAHAATCGAGVGMFLRIRECEIVLRASKTRGSTYPAPYLDDYGETDPHLVRGNPLHLCPERYRKLKQLWQQHCILEEIARSLEVVNVMFAFEWQML